MVTVKMSQQQYREETAQQNRSTADRVHKLTARNERLDHRAWTDEQLRAIPDKLVEFAFQHSAALRQEFRTLEAFMAYRRSLLRAKG